VQFAGNATGSVSFALSEKAHVIIDAGGWIAPSLRHCSVGGRWPQRAAVPHLQRALAGKATIDLKPFASNLQKKIAEDVDGRDKPAMTFAK